MRMMRVIHRSGQYDSYTAPDDDIDKAFDRLSTALDLMKRDERRSKTAFIDVADARAIYVLDDIAAVTVAPIAVPQA